MKKILILTLFLMILFSGCRSVTQSSDSDCTESKQFEITQSTELDTTEVVTEKAAITYKDSQIASVYRDVLNNELQFYSTDEQEWTYLNEFDYYDGEQGQEVDPLKFRLVDVNGDVNFEIQIVVTTPEEYPGMRAELLCYEDGKVYGYMLPRWISGGVRRDNIVEWDSFWLGKEPHNFGYSGLLKVSIENLELHYTFLFRESGSEEEEWLKANCSLIKNLSIEYVGDKYDEYEDLILDTNEYAEYTEENIEKYIR